MDMLIKEKTSNSIECSVKTTEDRKSGKKKNIRKISIDFNPAL
jgi:hypothetical protein